MIEASSRWRPSTATTDAPASCGWTPPSSASRVGQASARTTGGAVKCSSPTARRQWRWQRSLSRSHYSEWLRTSAARARLDNMAKHTALDRLAQLSDADLSAVVAVVESAVMLGDGWL